MTRRPPAILLAACFAVLASAWAANAAIEPPAEPPARAAVAAQGDDAARITADLERTRADMERRLKIVEEAQAMLKRGESLDAVRDFLKSKNMNIMARLVDERRRGPAAGPAGPRGLGVRDRSDRGGMRRMMGDRDSAALPPGPPGPPDDPRDGPGGPGGPGPGPGRDGRPPLMITVEEHQVIRDVLVQLMPQRLADLDDLAAKDPPEGERQFMKLVDSPRVRALIELRRSNPEAFRLRVEEFTAAAECSRRARAVVDLEAANAPAEKIEAERAALRAAAEGLFDKRINGLSMEVERLADKAASIRAELDEQTAHRAEHINRSIEQAIERAKRPPGPPGPGGPDGPRPPRDGERRPR